MNAINELRDVYGEYHCNISWHVYDREKYSGVEVCFSHVCGDGCCSWSNDYFIDKDSDLYNNLSNFFAIQPDGCEYCSCEDCNKDESYD